ncbi:IdgA domain-containing protein [Magnaporthiopsis poae ATCC 64411]|uniref:IdgA domain-containing protein n=1 Tax=Magnaporthiopsis poae (strain ATCC 64411 / 73-15) TaxID=644358 RepID=A0A0C4E2Y1_MAGP6|nr:IdgA domain-containing protein [Magnaporthiopsis poae ATCC 64411]
MSRALTATRVLARHLARSSPHGPKHLKSSYSCFRAYSHGRLGSILKVSQEVEDAIKTNRPVVALESTIYTHGAFDEDLGLESIVRDHGAVPAVIGIIDGTPTVGLTPAERDRIVSEGAKKVSRRDIAYLAGMGIAGRRMHGGTTIAGTMVLARLAGIRVFGTGGLGGVHRGWETTMDISADLTELGRTRVAVVSAGSKGFLDIPTTLEYLETQGVLVSTFADGRSGDVDFPAFWVRESGIKSPSTVQNETEAAAMILAQQRLDIESGILFANPIPAEHAIPREEMEKATNRAVVEAAELGFSGHRNTPFILQKIRELTNGASVPANLALVRANVARAARISVELSRLESGGSAASFQPSIGNVRDIRTYQSQPRSVAAEETNVSKVDILVAGSIALDLSCDFSPGAGGKSGEVAPKHHTSNPASITQAAGGVGFNVSLAAHRVDRHTTTRLCSVVGDDVAGATLLSILESSGMDTAFIRQLGREYHSSRTAQYVAVNDAEKNLVLAMADMDILSSHSFKSYWRSAIAASRPNWLVVDANWSENDIHNIWISAGREYGCRIAFETVSTYKSAKLFPPPPARPTSGPRGHSELLHPTPLVDLATPNSYELSAIYNAAKDNGYLENSEWFSIIDALGMTGARDRFVRLASAALTDEGIPQMSIQLLPYIPTILTKLGPKGVLLTMLLGPDDPRLRSAEAQPYILAEATGQHPHVGGVYMRLFPAVEEVKDVVSVNGAGDTFMGVLVAGLARGGKVEELVDVAQRAAVMTLRSHQAVSEELGRLEAEVASAAQR